MRVLLWTATLALMLAATQALPAESALVGRYGHDSTEPAAAPVFQVERVGDGYWLEYLAVGERETAWLLDNDGRAAFWDRMTWPAATAQDAECLSWGEASPTLSDFLEFATDAASPAEPTPALAKTFGAGVLCRVAPAARAKISWLSDYRSDYFFYDTMGGVMEVRPLPGRAAPLAPGAGP
jgi:hypothetical protein